MADTIDFVAEDEAPQIDFQPEPEVTPKPRSNIFPKAVSKVAGKVLPFGVGELGKQVVSPESWTDKSLLGISPEIVPSGAGTSMPGVTIPLSAVGKTAAGLGQFATSPKGISEMAVAATPAAPLMFAKWAYDMLKGGVTSVSNIGQELRDMITDAVAKGTVNANQLGPVAPGTSPEEHIQTIADNAVNAAVSFLGGGAAGLHAIKGIPKVTAATYTNPKTGETTTAPNHIEAAAEQGVEAPKSREGRETKDFGFQVETPKVDVWKSIAETRKNIEAQGYGIVSKGDEIYLTDQPASELKSGKPMRFTPDSDLEPPIKKLLEQYRKDWKSTIEAPPESPTVKQVVSRDEAENVARESGQLKEEPKGEKVHSDEIALAPAKPTEAVASPTVAASTPQRFKLRSEAGRVDGVIEGEGSEITVRASTTEEADGTHSVDSLMAFVPPKLMDRVGFGEGAPRVVIKLAEKITGKTKQEARNKAYQALTDEVNKGNFDIFKQPKEPPKQLPPPPPAEVEKAKGGEPTIYEQTKTGEVAEPLAETKVGTSRTGTFSAANVQRLSVSADAARELRDTQVRDSSAWKKADAKYKTAYKKWLQAAHDLESHPPPPSAKGTEVVPAKGLSEGAAQMAEEFAQKNVDELVQSVMRKRGIDEESVRKMAESVEKETGLSIKEALQMLDAVQKKPSELPPISSKGRERLRKKVGELRDINEGKKALESMGLVKPETLVPPPTGPESGQLGGGAAEAGEIPVTGAGGEKYGVAARVRAERAQAGQVEPVAPGKGINAPDSVEHGRELLRAGGDAEKALSEFEKSKRLSSDDMAIVRAHGESLAAGARTIEDQFGTDSPQYKEAFKKLSEWDKRSKAMQTEWHKTGMAQQGETDIDTGSFTGLQRLKQEITGEDFSKTEKPVAEKKAKQIKTLSDDLTQARTRLYDEMEKGGPISVAEKRALDAANRTVRENAIRLADLETKRRVADQARQTALDKAKQEADAKIAKAQTDAARNAAIKAAKAETDKRVAAAARAKAVEDVRIKAAQNALEAAQKRARDAAVKMAEAERKAQADPMRRVWNKVKEYIDRNSGKFTESFDDLRTKVAADLGMKVEQVTRLMAQDPRVKYLTDDLWRKQQQLRVMKEQAKRWVQNLSKPWIQKALESLPRALFRLKVGFHGTVALGTHAPMVAFQPRFWGTYIRDFGKMYELVGIKGLKHAQAYYEDQVQDLMRRPNYITARRAGLVNDPFTYEDFNTPITAKYFGNLTGMGNRGYTILKILRQDMFDQMWENLPKQSQIPEIAQAIADGVNHATGVVKGAAPKGSNIALFAPRLEASRVMWLAGDPIRAANTFLNWKKASLGEREFAMNQVKEKLWVAGTFFSMLALNQGFLNATGSKQKINGIPESLGGGGMNPFRSDFLKFKAAGMTESYGNPMLTMARLPLRLWVGLENEGKLNKIIHEDENTAKTLFDYARSQASPFAGLTLDLAFGRDFQQRPLPRAGFGFLPERKGMPKRLKEEGITKPYTWAEFAVEQGSPIPFQEAVREVWGKGLGMSAEDIKRYSKALAVLTLQAGTGARIGEDYYANPKPQTAYYVP